jgi:hypothetical protein
MASYIETSKFCKACNKQVLARRKGVNHILHLILSLLTFGIWVIIWILVVVKNIVVVGEWRCSTCGKICWTIGETSATVTDIFKSKPVDGVTESHQDSTPDQTKVFCSQCGEPNTKDNGFCAKCGKALT